MGISELPKKSALVFVISNLWQCRIYKKILNNINDKTRPILIVGLRSHINDKCNWTDVTENNIYHINISNFFVFKKLGFIQSFFDISKIRDELEFFMKSLPKAFFKNGISFVTDDLYRVHELTVLSLFKDVKEIICLQHGLRSKNNSLINIIKEPLVNQLRILIFCNFYRKIVRNTKTISFRKKCIYLSIFEPKKTKNKKSLRSGNLAIESSVIDLRSLNKTKNKNLLFMGSGAFRYQNEDDKKLAYDAILYTINLFKKNGHEKLFFKFKPDEDIKFLKAELKNNKNIIFLSQSFDLFDSIRCSLPELIICAEGSTVVAELFLSGYKNILYKTNFKGYDNFYRDIYNICGIKIQNLCSNNLEEVTDPSNLNTKVKMQNLVGYMDGGIKLVADLLN